MCSNKWIINAQNNPGIFEVQFLHSCKNKKWIYASKRVHRSVSGGFFFYNSECLQCRHQIWSSHLRFLL